MDIQNASMFSCDSVLSDSELEDAFNEDLTHDFTDEDKVYILAVVTRLRRILRWDPGDEERLLRKENGSEIIGEILYHFARWKQFIYEHEASGMVKKQHLMLYSLANLSVFYWIKDTNVVAEILREVYECDGHFSTMFARFIIQYDRYALWRQANGSRKKEDAATVFFVHHAHKARLEFGGARFINMPLRHPLHVTPIFLAIIFNTPYFLLYFLRYGGELQFVPSKMPSEWNLPMLLRRLVRVLWNSFEEDLQHLDLQSVHISNIMINKTNHTNHVAECLRILLRVIPQIKMGDIDFVLMKFNHGVLSGSVCSHDFIRLLSEKGLVPMLVNRYLEPSDLRHLCRCMIRKTLNRKWNLPYGIRHLPLPKLVKRYLSLLED